MPFELPTNERCPFCRNIAGVGLAVVIDDGETYAFVNQRMFGRGHLLVIPRWHAATVLDLSAAEMTRLAAQVRRLARAISKAFDPSGLNIFPNNGVTAGQTVAHYHVHIVPTYPGDQPGVFLSAQYERTPIEERLAVAAQIKANLELPEETSG